MQGLKLQISIRNCNLLDIPVNDCKLVNAKVITQDLNFDQLCSLMQQMDYPYVVFDGTVITPWDVCLTLLLKDFTEPPSTGYKAKGTCPHCGKHIG
jgi:hypothetical protein